MKAIAVSMLLAISSAAADDWSCEERRDGSMYCIDLATGDSATLSPGAHSGSRRSYSVDDDRGGYSGSVTVDPYQNNIYSRSLRSIPMPSIYMDSQDMTQEFMRDTP